MQSTDPHATSSRQAGLRRTGPVGRGYRLLVAVALLWGAYDLVGIDLSRLDMAISEPGLWSVFGLALVTVLFGGATGAFGSKWGLRAVAVAVALVAGIVTITVMADGRVGAVSWLVYMVDMIFLVAYGVLTMTAMLLGTPGCEVGAVRELVLRAQRRFTVREVAPHPCIVGFHLVDAWETRQPWRQER